MSVLRVNTIDAWVQKFLAQLAGQEGSVALLDGGDIPLKKGLVLNRDNLATAASMPISVIDPAFEKKLPGFSPAALPSTPLGISDEVTAGGNGSWLTSALSRFSLSH